jgi:hypothetical protein
MGKTFTTSDVAAHSKPDDLYIIVDEDVYDLTKFQDEHPGEHRASAIPQTELTPPRWKEDLDPGRRQRRLQAILEIPQ